MKNGGLVNEVFWLRCIACLAVTFGHAIQNGYHHYTEPSYSQSISYLLYMLMLFGLPVFVFISEFLLSHKYAWNTPPGFLRKRLKILLLPYIVMSTVYACFEVNEWNLTSIVMEISKNIFLGESTVYFVLIIFQFYLLHMGASKYLHHFSAKFILPLAFVINFAYLAFFNFVETPNNLVAAYIWNPGYWMPFAGWIFYFALGYYCGRNYEQLIKSMQRYKKVLLLLPVITFLLVIVMERYLSMDQSSKRVDILLFASSIILMVIYLAQKLQNVPKMVMLISNYSFSIFLLNELYFSIFLFINPPNYFNILSYSVAAFFSSLFLSICSAYLLNKYKFGKYVAGKVMDFQPDVKVNKGTGGLPILNERKEKV